MSGFSRFFKSFKMVVYISTVFSPLQGYAENPSDGTYIAFNSAFLALTNSGVKDFSCFGHQFNEAIAGNYAFAPIIFYFNSKPVIFDVGYIRTEVPYTISSAGVRIFGKGLLNFYGSFFFSYASKWDSYSDHSFSENYGNEYSARYRFSEISLSGGLTTKYSYNKQFNTRFYVGIGSRSYKESGYESNSYYSGPNWGEEVDYFDLDTKSRTVEISTRSLINLYGPVKLFFSFDILTNPIKNTEFIEPGKTTGLIGLSYII